MRNLKRVLSLTLASVMLLGMMVVGSAAKGYDDVSETDNVEAIEVLQAIEVMVGDERGFGPERPVNRAEMAVVMGKLLSLDYNYYTALCPFTDVYDWAQGWVGACYANKIVSGRGDGIYDPSATVTAVEAASMLMRALGYFQYQNDYTDGFELATVTQGKKIGIFDNVGSSASEPMTRNQVAQMVLNALQSAVVEPDGNTINLTTPDGSVITGKVNYVSVTSNKAYASAISDIKATSIGSTNDGWIVELGERLYDGKLKLTDDIDVFGRPSRKWEYDGKGIGVYAKKELLDKEYVGKVTGKDLFDELGKTTIDEYKVYCYVDGVYTEADGAKAALGFVSDSNLGAYFTAADMNKNNKAGIGGTGTGVKTEVYVDHDKDIVYVVVINTYLAIADKDYDTKKEEAPLIVYSIKKNSTIDEYIKVPQRSNVNGGNKQSIALPVEDFPSATEIKKDDPLLVTVADGEIQSYKYAEVLEAVTVTSFKKNDNVVSGGTKYSYTTTAEYKWADDINTNYTGSAISNLKDRTYNIYLDAYGNLIGIEEVEAVKNYVFITGIDLNGSNITNTTADANAIFLDGTMETIRINRTKSKLTVNSDSSDAILNTWCTYTKSGDIYTVKEVSDVGVTDPDSPHGGIIANYPSNTNNNLAQFNQTDTADMAVGGKNIRMYGGGNGGTNEIYTNVYGDSDTVYLTAELGKLKNDNKIYGVIEDVVSVTTGVANTDLTAWSNANAEKEANADKDVTGNVIAWASGIYGLYNDEGLIIAAVVVGEDAGSAKDLVYVHSSGLESEEDNGSSSTRANKDDLWTWTRKVIRDGVEVLLTEVGDEYNADYSLAKMEQYHWYEIRTNGDGHVTKAVEAPVALKVYADGVAFVPGASQYVTAYSKINDATEKTGVDTVLYLSNGGPEFNGAWSYTNGFSQDLEVKGKNTLAVEGLTGSGIHFKDDVHVVLQYWNKNTKVDDIMEGEGVDDLKKMVDIVNEYNDIDGARTGFTYYVSALIKDGRATDIVIFDSYNPYKRPGSTENPSSNGAISMDEDIAAYGSITGDKVTVSKTGQVTADFTLTAPTWAKVTGTNAATDIDHIYYQVWVDGEYDHSYVGTAGTGVDLVNALKSTDDGKTYTAASASLLSNMLTRDFAMGKSISIIVTEIVWKNANVKYYEVDADGKEVRELTPSAGYTDSLPVVGTSGTPAAVTFTLNAANVSGSFTLDGATKSAGTFSGTITTSAGNSAATYEADGGKVVKVLVKPTGTLAVNYDVKTQGATGMFTSNVLNTADRTDGVTVTGLPTGSSLGSAYVSVVADKNTVAENGYVTWTAATNAYGSWDGSVEKIVVSYVIESTNETGTFVFNGHGANNVTTKTVKASGNLNLKVTGIELVKVVYHFYVTDAVLSNSNKTLTVSFNKSAVDWHVHAQYDPATKKPGANNFTFTAGNSRGTTLESAEINANGQLVLTFNSALSNDSDTDKIVLDACVGIFSENIWVKKCEITFVTKDGKLEAKVDIV